ncbi:MAG: EAL domain-containing protein [Spirochaetaceae bacterium]
MSRIFGNWSLSGRLAFLFVTIMVTTYASVWIVSDIFLRRGVTQQLEAELLSDGETLALQLAESIRRRLESDLEGHSTAAIQVLTSLSELAEAGSIPDEEARRRAESYLLDVDLGAESYFYALDRNGVFAVHPFPEFQGYDAGEIDLIRQQLDRRTGFVEYEWQNPADSEPRPKVAYLAYFEPFDWIVAASQYLDRVDNLFDASRLRSLIQTAGTSTEGATFLFGREGQILASDGSTLVSVTLLKTIRESPRGSGVGLLPERRSDMVAWYPVEGTGWVVAVSGGIENTGGVVARLRRVLLLTGIVAVVVASLFGTFRTLRLLAPLRSLLARLEESPLYDPYLPRVGTSRNEVDELAVYLESMLDSLRQEVEVRKAVEHRNASLAQFSEQNPDPVVRVSMDGVVLYWNRAAETLVQNWSRVGSRVELPEALRDTLGTNRTRTTAYHLDHRIFLVTAIRLVAEDYVYLYLRDVTEERKNESLLNLSEAVFKNAIEGIVITDGDGTIERVNPAFTQITGYEASDAVGRNPRILKSDRHDDAFYANMWQELLEKGEWSGEIWNRRRSGESYPELLSIRAVRDENGRIEHFAAVFHDITALKKTQERLRHQAYHDALTGLPNRDLLTDRLEQALATRDRNDERLALVFLDVDNFKTINDSLGHEVGDEFLRLLARSLRTACRAQDTVARFGGDEFVYALTRLHSSQEVADVVHRIQMAVEHPISVDGRRLSASASVGVAIAPDDGIDAPELLRNADAAMYQAKRGGKGRVVFYNPRINRASLERLELEAQLRRAVAAGDLKLYLQPVIEVESRIIRSAEGLIRWERRPGEWISPNVFIPIAEESGLIHQVGRLVMEQAASMLRDLRERGYEDFSLSVNASPLELGEPEFVSQVRGLVDTYGIRPESLVIEVTEGAAMERMEDIRDVFSALADLGIRVALDDFGVGYSSLSYLTSLPVDRLKIDRSFVVDLDRGETHQAAVRGILSLAKGIGLHVTAEGVDSTIQRKLLESYGCDSLQGFLFGKAVPFEEFIEKHLARSAVATLVNLKNE